MSGIVFPILYCGYSLEMLTVGFYGEKKPKKTKTNVPKLSPTVLNFLHILVLKVEKKKKSQQHLATWCCVKTAGLQTKSVNPDQMLNATSYLGL